jgi:hypothetical protein
MTCEDGQGASQLVRGLTEPYSGAVAVGRKASSQRRRDIIELEVTWTPHFNHARPYDWHHRHYLTILDASGKRPSAWSAR